jgi:DNA modification methylase
MKIEKIKVDEIIPYADNAKLHPERQIEQIKSSILEFGFNDPIAIDENNVVIEGNGRLMAIKDLGFKEVDCIRIEGLTEEQKRAYILVHNQLTMNTGFDIDILNKELEKIKDIDMTQFDFDIDFIPAIWGAMKDNCPVYEFCGWQSLKQWLEYFENTNLDLKNVIIWKKNNWSMGDLKGAYAGQYEVILYLNKGRVELNGARDTDIWEFDREPPKMHPTMKPIELIAYALNKSSKKDDVVLDCFGGSGSTLIACEQLNRKCYMCELDPHYCDVIIQRWENFTGKKAELIEG